MGIKKLKKVAAASGVNENNSDASNDSKLSSRGNAAWANCIAKVLNTTKPKAKKTLVLSRARLHKEENQETNKRTVDYGFEIDGEIKQEEPRAKQLERNNIRPKSLPLQFRVKPSWKDFERERTLRKVATSGVVQFFNAVRMQQKDLQKKLNEAGSLDSRKDAVLNNINKKKFLDVLMSGNRAKSQQIDNGSENEDDVDNVSRGRKKKSEWSVLREDFMTNKKLKHWDEEQESEDSEQNTGGEETDVDDTEI